MELSITQNIILGIIQGISEWLPISSSGMITLIMANFFGITEIGFLLHYELLLHLGTTLAAITYFRKDILKLIQSLFYYKESSLSTQKVLKFLIISTIISGILGAAILITLENFESALNLTGKTVTGLVAILLFFTGVLQLKTKNAGLKKETDLKNSDSLILGTAQGIASLPGISRSGITVSSLLLKKFDDTTALRLSFLMSIPIIIFGNLILNFHDLTKVASSASFYGILTSFIFGLLTIQILIKLSKKVNFGWFILIFAVLMSLSLLV